MPCTKRPTFSALNSGCHLVRFCVLGRNMPMSLFFSIVLLRFKNTGNYHISTEDPAGNKKAERIFKDLFWGWKLSHQFLQAYKSFLFSLQALTFVFHLPHPTLHPNSSSWISLISLLPVEGERAEIQSLSIREGSPKGMCWATDTKERNIDFKKSIRCTFCEFKNSV